VVELFERLHAEIESTGAAPPAATTASAARTAGR
jgi:hypothetical protein